MKTERNIFKLINIKIKPVIKILKKKKKKNLCFYVQQVQEWVDIASDRGSHLHMWFWRPRNHALSPWRLLTSSWEYLIVLIKF